MTDDPDAPFVWSPCRVCGYLPSDATLVDELERREEPRAGSLMICLACGELSMVEQSQATRYLRELSDDERRRALADPRVVRALVARALVMRRHES